MSTTARRLSEEVARLGSEMYDRQVLPALRPEDYSKFVALDILSGDYELNDYTAVSRLRSRHPSAEIWLSRAGRSTAYVIAGGIVEISALP